MSLFQIVFPKPICPLKPFHITKGRLEHYENLTAV